MFLLLDSWLNLFESFDVVSTFTHQCLNTSCRLLVFLFRVFSCVFVYLLMCCLIISFRFYFIALATMRMIFMCRYLVIRLFLDIACSIFVLSYGLFITSLIWDSTVISSRSLMLSPMFPISCHWSGSVISLAPLMFTVGLAVYWRCSFIRLVLFIFVWWAVVSSLTLVGIM